MKKMKYYTPEDFCPIKGYQLYNNVLGKNNTLENDPGGFCAAWSIHYIDLRLSNPDVEPEKLIKRSIDDILKKELNNKTKSVGGLFKRSIRNYSTFIIEENKTIPQI